MTTISESRPLRADLLFSYWIYAWFLFFYVFRIRFFNPALALWIALLENIVAYFFVMNTMTWRNRIQYAAVVAAIKGIPLYLLRGFKIHWIRDAAALSGLFAAYNGWLYLHNTDLWTIYKQIYLSLKNNEGRTPAFHALEWLGRRRWWWAD
jgi:signal transduction histidine kinase